MIADVAVDSRGRVFIVDLAFEKVRVFSPTGSPLFEIGRSGDGPLEFRSPMAIMLRDPDSVIVVDAAHGIKIFRSDASGRTSLLTHRGVNASTRDACAVGSEIAVLVSSANREDPSSDFDHMIRVVPPSGTTRSFGAGYRSSSQLVRYVLGEGAIGCIHNVIVAGLSALPFVRAFRPDGHEQWVAQLDDFQIPRYLERINSRGQPAFGLDPEVPPSNAIRKVSALGARHVLVQTVLVTRQALQDRSMYSDVDTYLFDAANGQGVYVGKALPLVDAVASDVLYATSLSPFPRVVKFRLPPANATR
jgi:hypothetical protein